jgi:hypothetical protein
MKWKICTWQHELSWFQIRFQKSFYSFHDNKKCGKEVLSHHFFLWILIWKLLLWSYGLLTRLMNRSKYPSFIYVNDVVKINNFWVIFTGHPWLSLVVSNFYFSQRSITWPILIGHMDDQIAYKWNASEILRSHLSFFSSASFFNFYNNVTLFNFGHFVCKWAHSPPSISHRASSCVFIYHSWVLYANRRGTFLS